MKITATHKDGLTSIRALIDHPMESGNRSDLGGNPIPENSIRTLLVTCREQSVMTVEVGDAMSKNPYLDHAYGTGVSRPVRAPLADRVRTIATVLGFELAE